jgi:uncharacterized protein
MTESNVPPPPPPSEPTPASSLPYQPVGGSGYPAPYIGPAPDKDARTWGMLAHLSALVQLLGIPSIVGPLVVWLIKKNEFPFVDDQGKESLNFNLTVLLAALVISPTICLAGLGIILLIALGVAALILAIIGAMKANEGVAYRYPWTLRLIK